MSRVGVMRISQLIRMGSNDLLIECPKSEVRTRAWLTPLVRENGPRKSGDPSLLIMSPTRESVHDIVTSLHTIRDKTSAVVTAVGGSPREVNVSELRRGCDYLLGTPARLLSLAKEKQAPLDNLSTIVVDEAQLLLSSDLVLDLLQHYVPKSTRRVLCTSSKLDGWYDDIIRDVVVRPGQQITIIRTETSDEVTQTSSTTPWQHFYVTVSPSEELKQIRYIIDHHRAEAHEKKRGFKAVISPRSTSDTFSFHKSLMFSDYIFVHPDMSAEGKAQQLSRFKVAKNAVLVASHIPDAEGISLHVTCGVPKSIEAYTAGLRSNLQSPKSVVVVRTKEFNTFKRNILTKSGGIHFGTLPLPSSDDLSIGFASRFFRGVQNESFAHLDPTAKLVSRVKTLVEQHGMEFVAGLMEMVEKKRTNLDKVSVLSGMPGFTPVLLLDPAMKKLKSHETCQKLLKNCLRRTSKESNSSIGRIVLSEKGFVADVPTERLGDLMNSSRMRNIKPIVVSELPRLVDNTKLFVMRQVAKDRALLLSRRRKTRPAR